jgi:hypothetical protein
MRPTRKPLTLKKLMWAIVLLALITTVSLQTVQIQRGRVREEHLRASLAEADAKFHWVESLNEWQRVGDSPALKKKWADGLRRGQETMPR